MLTPQHRQTLRQVAAESIQCGLANRRATAPDPAAYPEPLRPLRATFVTLERYEQLRGCIGTLEAVRPLVQDVAANAYAAAFSDPRFPPLLGEELDGLTLHISILSPPEPMAFTGEADLIGQLRPGVDGLILSDGRRRGTFLPSVWESLPQPEQFLAHLKVKAGLPVDYWSDTLRVERYSTESFGGPFEPPPKTA